MTIPVFKSHYSIGKSILTLNAPSKVKQGGADSIIDIALDAGLKQVTLVEDTMHGFLEAKRGFEQNNLQLIFGIRINMCQNYDEDKERITTHKIIVLAKNDEGVKRLYKIYSFVHCDQNKRITEKDLKSFWSNDDLMLVIPFYDSFLYQNNFKYDANFMHTFTSYNPIFFIENNLLPQDFLMKSVIEDFAKTNNFKTQKAKSIYYRNRKDFRAFQTYKMITSRSFSKKANIQAPNIDGCASDEFCMESWLDDN